MYKRSWNKDNRRRRGGRGNQNFNRNNSKPMRSSSKPAEQLSEIQCGITEYFTSAIGFSGVIKARYSDFQVNEIDVDGNVAKYTENKMPVEFVEPKALANPPADCPTEYIDQNKWDEILKMMKSDEAMVVLIDVNEFDKDKRSQLHKVIKKIFGNTIVSETKEDDSKKVISLKKYVKSGENRRGQTDWPDDVGEYVHFILYKESLDTMEAIMKLSDTLRIPPALFNYAGVKDRRAKTSQWVSIRKVAPWKLLFKTKNIHNLKIGNLKFKNVPLKLGQLSGNKFRVAIRNVTVDEDIIRTALTAVEKNGFINYYGLQRFGTDKEVPTYDIGIQLLKGNWKEACDLILKPKKHDDPLSSLTEAKKVYYETADAEKAFSKLCGFTNSTIEAKLLKGLAKSGKNEYVNALESIPRNTRLLYIHAFQSLVWNQVVSRRIKDFGLKPVVGDLVYAQQTEVMDTLDVDCSDEEETAQKFPEVKILEEADLDNYSIYDIILPLPGYDVVYPENKVKDYYKEILTIYDLELEMHKQRVKTYNLSGTYRSIVTKTTNFSWKLKWYNEPHDNLIRSDFEEVLGHSEPKDIDNGKYKAVIVEFTLPSCAYATMVLREILKIDTSKHSQSKLNDYHEQATHVEGHQEIENSLLSNKDKFEAFKKAIFDSPETDLQEKRKIDEEDLNNCNNSKKLKNDENDEDSHIKIQASLV